MPKDSKIRLLAFDFDGTLVHTAPDIIKATNEFLLLHGHEPLTDAEVINHIGNGLVGLVQGVVPEAEHHPELRATIEAQFTKIYDEYVLDKAQPYPGVIPFLNSWRHKIAIVSNKPERYLHLLLRHLKMDQYPWAAVIGGDTFSEKKPHPMPLEAAMKAAGVRAEETLMIGDGPPDMGVAQECGTHLLAITFGYSPIEELQSLGAVWSMDHFDELPQKIQQIERGIQS